jgi:predicted acetyltransferase
MNLRGAKVPAGGVGFVAVDLMHKKEHVAKDMIAGFLGACQEHGQHMALLYPFRPDFYRQMGFGYGTKMSHYRARPAHLPNAGDRSRLRMLTAADKPLLAACYGRLADARHGLIEKSALEIDGLFGDAAHRFVGYERGGELAGYLMFTFAPERDDSFMFNNLVVEELVYQDREALAGLLTFLHTQADQIQYVVFDVQDDTFHQLVFDPRNGTQNVIAGLYQETNTQGVGMMYRVLDTPALFASLAGCDFNRESCRLKIEVRDSFVPTNSRATVVHFAGGHPRVADGGDYEIAIALDVADFSALLMGSVGFAALHRYGQAEISDPRGRPRRSAVPRRRAADLHVMVLESRVQLDRTSSPVRIGQRSAGGSRQHLH